MISIIYRKVWRDLAHNKTRTFLAVLSTAVGLFALGVVFGLSGVIRERLTADNLATIPAHIQFYTSPFEEDIVETVAAKREIESALGEASATIRWQLAGTTDWHDGTLAARRGYKTQVMNLIELQQGEWPGASELAVERQSALFYNIPLEGVILIEASGRQFRLPVKSIVRDPKVAPPQIAGTATFYTAPETLDRLVRLTGYNVLYVRLRTFANEEATREYASELQDQLKKMDVEVGGFFVSDPSKHFAQDQIDGIFTVMGVIGALSLALGAFLIINTMNALVAQQIWQIGVMKAVGAGMWRVMRVYLATALIYGGLALLLAVPLGGLAAFTLAQVMLDFFNVSIGGYRMDPTAVGMQLCAGLGVPLVAALLPVIGGARITVREAISSYGLGQNYGSNVMDRLMGNLRRLPRPLALSLRNTFRRKSRVVLTLLTLVISGILFVMIMSVGDSLRFTIEMFVNDFGFDVFVVFERPYRTVLLESVTMSVPGVDRMEIWDIRSGTLKLAGGQEVTGQLWGVPTDSQMFAPRITAGRNLDPADEYAILLNQKIAADYKLQVGQVITMTIGDEKTHWTVVGLVFNINNNQRDNFVPYQTLVREFGAPNRGSLLMLRGQATDVAGQRALIEALRAAYKSNDLKYTAFLSEAEFRQQANTQFDMIIMLLLLMAVLSAMVGSLGLASTMSINVVERSREIGVMRSIGAGSWTLLGIFVTEGMLLGLISWLLAVPLSYPLSKFLTDALGTGMLGLPIDFSYSTWGMVIWLVIVTVLAALASLWPAWRATRISVREALAYE